MVNKAPQFADFVKFRPHTYTRTQQSLAPLWSAIINNYANVIKVFEGHIKFKNRKESLFFKRIGRECRLI